MPPTSSLDWDQMMKVDPDALLSEEKLADELLDTLLKVDGKHLRVDDPKMLVQLFRITQSLMKMKAQEAELALEEVEKAGEEQAKTESQLKSKVMKLENELEKARLSTGGRDTRFLRDEIQQLENQLEQKERELDEIEKELEKEKKVNEQLALKTEEAENANSKLRRENEQLRQDIIDYQKQIDSQRETLLSRRGDDSEYRTQLSKKNLELVQYLDENQALTEANEKLELENAEMRKNLEESVLEMEKMTDEYNKMKLVVQQTDLITDQSRKEKEQLLLQVEELTQQLQARNEEDDPVMMAVNAKVEEWKAVLLAKDDELLEYQQILRELREKLRLAQLDSDKNNVMALRQAIQERDSQIKIFTEQLEQYTTEMEKNALIVEELKKQLQKDSGLPSFTQQKIGDLQSKLHVAEQRATECSRIAEVAEADAKQKDKELSEALKRLREYEVGIYGLEDAVAEIRECKNKIKIRDHETESLNKEINKLDLKINDLLDENEDLRERLGLDPRSMADITVFKQNKALKQQQYHAENQVLLKEIERLEEERLNLKRHIRKLAQEKGKRAASLGLTADDLHLNEYMNEVIEKKTGCSVSFGNLDTIKDQNECLSKELNEKDRELELKKTEVAQMRAKLKAVEEENKQLEQGMKEILQAVKNTQKDPSIKGGETVLKIHSLERLVNAIEMKNSDGSFDATLHLKAQVDQLTGRNEELRQELRNSRKEAIDFSNQLEKANEKSSRLENDLQLLQKQGGSNLVFRSLNLPDGMAPSSVDIINSLNEYAVQLLQEIENNEQSVKKLEDALEEYKRKFAVIRHQQGLLYKEYQSERDSWQKETEKVQEENKKLEDQKEVDAVKITEYNRLLETLQLGPEEVKKQLAESFRKMTVLRVNEKSLMRRFTTVLEMEQHLRKENNKLKNEMISVEAAVGERIGYLQRYKDMAAFKIAALQKALDDSVPSSELERANKQYNELTAKYRDLLQKDNLLVQRATHLEHLESENKSLHDQISVLNKEMEITKEKLHTLEQAWEQLSNLGGETALDKATKAVTNSEIMSISKKITMLEMKELNERQRAEHAHKMYEHMRNTLTQVEERNFELEAKFSELSKMNLEAQKMENELRDELASSVSKAVSDADRKQIMVLEKSEAELKAEVSKLKDISDVAKMQVTTLESRQQSREKEVESLRQQVLDYQVQSDEKALIAKLHQHIVALQISEASAVAKLETVTSKLQKLESFNLRLEQKLDDKEQTLYYARLEGRNRAKHLSHALQSLRRQFSGALPLVQQEKFSKTMVQLQNDKLKIMQELQQAQQERKSVEDKAALLEAKLKGLEELINTLKDARGAQKVSEWHKKMEELRLQDLKLNREINRQKEEIQYLNNVIAEHERTISSLEEELVQQNKFFEEQQLAWDQRQVQLERQLDMYEHQHNEVLSTARKFEEATGAIPDPSLPVPQQLEIALRKIKEHICTILETQAACKTLEEKLKEKEAALWKAEHNVLSRDKVINELRLRLPATAEHEKLLADLGKNEADPEFQKALKIAHQTIENMQARLNQKEEVLKKYQQLLAQAREEREEIAKKHEDELRTLYHKLDLHADSSLNKFKQTALELIKKPALPVATAKHLARLVDLEQIVAEQDNSLAVFADKLKKCNLELEKQKQITVQKIKEHENKIAVLETKHAVEVKELRNETNDLKSLLSQMEKESQYLKTELETQKEANTRAPTTAMKNLVERLKNQMTLKEAQQKALSKALLRLREEMTLHAEQQIIAAAAQKEENLNVQQIVDKQTRELKTQVDDLMEQLVAAKENLKAVKTRESSATTEIDALKQDLQKKQKIFNSLTTEKEETEKENEDLKKRIRRLMDGMKNKSDTESKTVVAELQRKIKKLEAELEKKAEHVERKPAKEDRTSNEEIVRWEEGKKWQSRIEAVKNKVKEKEKEVETLTKQLGTLKELYTKVDQEKSSLQRKIKARGVTVDQVVGVRTAESERELDELRKRNMDLEDQIIEMKTQQALPRDSALEDLQLKNHYLQEKLQVLEKQLLKENPSRPSTSGIGFDSHSEKEQELHKENLRLSAENIELRFQLEQSAKDLPRLKDQVADLKEMCEILKREKAELERKLGNVRGAGRSGKTIPELEKTIGLMKKVVEKVQRENEELKKAPGVVASKNLAALEQENEKLKSELEKLQLQIGGQLSMRYESKTRGVEKIITENERLCKELKKETDISEKLRIAKNNLEITNEKLTVQLEELTKRLHFAESRGPQLEGADSKSWKSIVVTRMYESKLKELETDLSKKSQTISDLKQLLRESTEREQKLNLHVNDLNEQIELLKHFPEDAKSEPGLNRELQLIRLTNDRLEKEKAELIHQLEVYRQQDGAASGIGGAAGYDELLEKGRKNDQLMAEVVDLQTQLKTMEMEKHHLQEDVKKFKKELDNFDPSFFEEIEDLKFNYNQEVKKNILLEERLKKLADQFGVQVDIPATVSL